MMKPYFETKLGALYNCDCLEFMKEMEDDSVDLVLTDPPYGVGMAYDVFDDTFENVKNLMAKVMPEVLRISNRTALTCATRQIGLYPLPKWILCWFNKAGTGMNPWGFTCWQPVLVYGKDPYLENRKGSRPDYIEHSEASKKIGHPCPKPDKFWVKLLDRCSVIKSDTVFDPFIGGGATGIACEKLGRKWTGVEISEKYCEIAAKRISLEANQGKLW